MPRSEQHRKTGRFPVLFIAGRFGFDYIFPCRLVPGETAHCLHRTRDFPGDLTRSYSALLLTMSLLLGVSVQSPAQARKYDIKSGIVTFDIAITIGDMKVASKAIVYFDDYGMKECKETYTGDKLSHVYFSDGTSLYKLVPSKKQAVKNGNAISGTELRYDWAEASSKGEEERHAKKIPNVMVAGKNCEAFQTTQKETICTFAGWNHILLSVEIGGGSSRSITKAVKVEENVQIPADKFKVPAGYTLQSATLAV